MLGNVRVLMGSGFSAGQVSAMKGTHAFGKTAEGTTQANAYLIGHSLTEFSTVPAGSGAILPSVNSGLGHAGDFLFIINSGANALLIYPPVGGAIPPNSLNAPLSLAVGGTIIFVSRGNGQYFGFGIGSAPTTPAPPPADVSAPQFVSAAVSNANPSRLVITFNEAITSTITGSVTTSPSRSVVSQNASGSTLEVNFTAPFVFGDTITATLPAGLVRDAANNASILYTAQPVTNNIAAPADTTAPTFVSANIYVPGKIVVAFSETLSSTLTGSVTLGGTPSRTVVSATVVGSNVEIVPSADYAPGDAPTVSYPAGWVRDTATTPNTVLAGTNRAVTNNLVAPGSIATTFDAMSQYTGAWVADTAMTTVTTSAQTMPAKSTSITGGGYTDANFGTFVANLTRPSDTNDAGMNFLRHDYSRRSPWNADSSKYVLLGENGWWQLFNANTNARIPGTRSSSPGVGALNGPGGQCEWCWHLTDPNRAVHTGNNGSMQWYVHDLTTQTSTLWFDLTSKVAALGGVWATVGAGRTSFKGEGMPSRDWRYFCLLVTTSGFGTVGVIRYDSVLDVIDWALPLTNTPDHVSTSPVTGKPVVSWYGSAATSLALEQARTPNAAAGARVFDPTTNDQQGTALCVVGQHSDLFVDHLDRECFAWITFHGDADGLLDGSVVWCLLSDPSQRWATPVRVFPEEAGVGRGVHLSGCCWDRKGWIVVSIYSGTGNNAHSGRVVAVEMVPGGDVLRLANHHSNTGVYDPDTESGLAYAAEPQAVPNRDLTRIMWASNMGNRANGIQAMQLGLPSDAIPAAGLEPVSRTANPTITGTATAGGTLTRTLGTYAGFPAPTITGRWETSTNSGSTWAAVSPADTDGSYTIPGGTANGVMFRWGNEIATQAGGGSTTAANSNTATVAALAAPANTVAPSVATTGTDAAPITATAGTWTGNPVPTLTYVWQQNTGSWVDSAYTTLTASLPPGTWRMKVSATNTQGGPILAYSGSCVVSAAPAFVQASNPGLSAAPVLTTSTTAGRLLVVDIVQTYGANPPRAISSVMDSVDSAAYTLARSQVNGSGTLRVDTYYRIATGAGARQANITLSGTGAYTALLTEYRGATTLGPVNSAGAASGTSIAPGSATVTNGIYHLALGVTSSYSPITVDAGYTVRGVYGDDEGSSPTMYVADRINSGASNPTSTIGASTEWAAVISTFS